MKLHLLTALKSGMESTFLKNRLSKALFWYFPSSFRLPNLRKPSSKTKETAFQILNRTVWTNNKAFQSGLLDPPPVIVGMRSRRSNTSFIHAPNYSEKLWLEIGQTLTSSITQYANEYTVRIEFTPNETIFNKPHPAILLRIND